MPDLDELLTLLPGSRPSACRVLVADDDETILETLKLVLEGDGFQVVTAGSVNQALKCIACQPFDVLVSDLHMPEQGDGLTVVSAMRHANPKAVTLIFSAFPEMQQAADALVKQTDEVIIKPSGVANLIEAIRDRLQKGANTRPRPVESVADVLERETQSTIDDWLSRIDRESKLIPVKLDREERARFLPEILRDVVRRLRSRLPLGTRSPLSSAASEHGMRPSQLGYTPAMLVEESRILQVSILRMLEKNLQRIDYSAVLLDVMIVADELASQVAQTVTCFQAEAKLDGFRNVA